MANLKLFEKLPQEIQSMIWEAALEDTWVALYPGKTQFRYSQAMAIYSVCRSAREHVKRTHHFRLIRCGRFLRRSKRWDVVPVNPDKDTFIKPFDWGRSPRLACCHPYPAEEKGISSEKEVLRIKKLLLYETTMKPEWTVFGRDVLREYPRNIDPDVDHDPRFPHWPPTFDICDFTFVAKKAHPSWWLGDEYRVHGPVVVSRPAENCLWHGKREEGKSATWSEDYLEGNPVEQGLEYYEKMGISDDTGMTWPFDRNYASGHNMWKEAATRRLGKSSKSAPEEVRRDWRWWAKRQTWARDVSGSVPKVGLRGFSYNISSCGGLWAGYRFYLGDRPRLEFSPLTWDDVKDYLHSFQTHEDNREDGYPRSEEDELYDSYIVDDTSPSFPQMVVKVTIIKPGEAAPPSSPHHCWEPVAGDFSGCGDLKGVDWRQKRRLDPPPSREELRKLLAPGFNRPLSDREEVLLNYLNSYRILSIFYSATSTLHAVNHVGFEAYPYCFHESQERYVDGQEAGHGYKSEGIQAHGQQAGKLLLRSGPLRNRQETPFRRMKRRRL